MKTIRRNVQFGEFCVDEVSVDEKGSLHLKGASFPSEAPVRNSMEIEEGTFFQWEEYAYFVSFGVVFTDTRKMPGHGGRWSSRPGILHKMTGIKVIETTFHGTTKYMKASAVDIILASTDYMVEAKEDSSGEIRCKVVKKPEDMKTGLFIEDCCMCGETYSFRERDYSGSYKPAICDDCMTTYDKLINKDGEVS